MLITVGSSTSPPPSPAPANRASRATTPAPSGRSAITETRPPPTPPPAPPPTPPPLSEVVDRLRGQAWIQHAGRHPTPRSPTCSPVPGCNASCTPATAPSSRWAAPCVGDPAQKDALIARDLTCVIPGCTVPGEHCQVHHVIPWAAGGPTDLHNMTSALRPAPHRNRPGNLGDRNDQRRPLGPRPLLDRPHPTPPPQPRPLSGGRAQKPALQPAAFGTEVVRVSRPPRRSPASTTRGCAARFPDRRRQPRHATVQGAVDVAEEQRQR